MTVLLPPSHPLAINAIPVVVVSSATWRDAAKAFGEIAMAFAENQDFDGKAGQMQPLPASDGRTAAVLFGGDEVARASDPFVVGRLATGLPDGIYRVEGL